MSALLVTCAANECLDLISGESLRERADTLTRGYRKGKQAKIDRSREIRVQLALPVAAVDVIVSAAISPVSTVFAPPVANTSIGVGDVIFTVATRSVVDAYIKHTVLIATTIYAAAKNDYGYHADRYAQCLHESNSDKTGLTTSAGAGSIVCRSWHPERLMRRHPSANACLLKMLPHCAPLREEMARNRLVGLRAEIANVQRGVPQAAITQSDAIDGQKRNAVCLSS